jgi:hypothetical protein
MIPKIKRAQIIEALKANPNASAVARAFGVGNTAGRAISKQANIKLAGKRKVSPEQRAQIIAALRVNPNAVAVAAAMGWSDTTVTLIAREAEIPLKMGGRFKTVADKPKAASAAARCNAASAAA